jgi:hypothetical protein
VINVIEDLINRIIDMWYITEFTIINVKLSHTIKLYHTVLLNYVWA